MSVPVLSLLTIAHSFVDQLSTALCSSMFAVQALPLIIIFLQFCLATAPPSLELPGRVQRVQVGLGLGAGGRGRQSWDWGVRECREGESGIPDH